MASEKPKIAEVGGVPEGSRRTHVSILIGVLLALQLLIPLRYYLGDDPYDERFSWRMFSAVRVVTCNTQVVDSTTSGTSVNVQLMRTIHEAWVNHLRRNREAVIEAFMHRRCREDGVAAVRLTNQCVDAEGQRIEPIVWNLDCESGELDVPENRHPGAEGP